MVLTKDETKSFNCAAGSYVINGRSFETTAALKFTADAKEIKIPLSDAATEIYFDGVEVSGVKDGGELIFDLASDKIFVPNGAIINVSSSESVKLNLVAGDFTINDNKISSAIGIEISADKDNIKIPLSSNAVTINGAKITGKNYATIDSQKIIALPDGALVENISENIFKLTGKDSGVSFGDALNIFTVSNLVSDSGSTTAAVTAITKKLGTVDGNFEKEIQVNAAENKDDYMVKASNSDKDIEIALDAKGKMSVEKIEGGANVEKYGQAQKVITVKNDKEYSLQIADYKYTVNGDLDDDGITTFINNSEGTPNIYVADDQIITGLGEKSSVQVDKRSFTLRSATARTSPRLPKSSS